MKMNKITKILGLISLIFSLSVSCGEQFGNEQLMRACLVNCLSSYKLSILWGGNVNYIDENGHSPVYFACRNCKTPDILKLLVEKGADLNFVISRNGAFSLMNIGDSLLHTACFFGNIEACKFLIEKQPALVNAINENGYNPIHWACKWGYLEIYQLLIQNGAATHGVSNCGKTLLHLACDSGSLEICQLLIKSGANINAVDSNGNKPFHRACQSGHAHICEFLLQYLINQ